MSNKLTPYQITIANPSFRDVPLEVLTLPNFLDIYFLNLPNFKFQATSDSLTGWVSLHILKSWIFKSLDLS